VPENQRRPIERTSPNDLMALAAESAAAPMQVAAVLVLDRPVALAAVRDAVADRVRTVPRLRQRLQTAPLGCGRPVWVDDGGFAIDRHIAGRPCPAPGDEAAMLEAAAAAAVHPLPRDHPLWSVTVISGLSGGRSALVLVLHHVVADGIGGLALLTRLVDGAPALPEKGFPAPSPTFRDLLGDATAMRIRALRRWRAGLRLVGRAATELRLDHVAHPPRCSLNQPTGRNRRFAVARADLAALASTAHARGGTINDALLTAVAGALAAGLRERGESADSFVISVPVSDRRDASATQLGNRVGVMPVEVPAGGDPMGRLAAIIAITRVGRRTRGRAASATLLGPAFRVLAGFGLFQWFVNHQHVVTTFATNMHGPRSPITFLGATVTDFIPVTSTTGNVTVTFAALSYAGTLTVTVIADPDTCPDLKVVVAELQGQLDALTTAALTVQGSAGTGGVLHPGSGPEPNARS